MADINFFATIDFETYYDREFSLSKMQTDEYVLDSRFEIIGVGCKVGNGEIEFFSGSHQEVCDWLVTRFNWATTPVCFHNAQFDGFICTQILKLKPYIILDTISMARMVYPWWKSYSLKNVSNALEIGSKGTEVVTFMGYQLQDFTEDALRRYGEYCKNDVGLTHTIAEMLIPKIPLLEIMMIDMTVRMFTEPRIKGDTARLVAYHNQEVSRKIELVNAANADKEDLMSNEKFADKLRDLGIKPPMKISKRTGKWAFAFAKNDRQFTDLLNCGVPEVEALVSARIGVKSTISETRALRMIHASHRGLLPVHLNHWGAKTTGRLSGGNKMNYQNIPSRGLGKELRKCMVAPEGYKIVVGDSSNIELRVVMACAGDKESLALLYNGDDLYCDFASKLHGRVITKEDKKERMLGKVAMLSLQYGAGSSTFRHMVRMMAGIVIDEDEAQSIVNIYRNIHPEIRDLWDRMEYILRAVQNGEELVPLDKNAWVLTTEDGFAIPGLPGVCYNNLRRGSDGSWEYRMGDNYVHIYGGKVVENLCQHIARHIVMWQTLRVHRKYPVSISVHDEMVCVVPEEEAEACKAYMLESLRKAPVWCEGEIPLEGEVAYGDSYGEAKI
jgi:DNA polymerase